MPFDVPDMLMSPVTIDPPSLPVNADMQSCRTFPLVCPPPPTLPWFLFCRLPQLQW